LNIARDMMEMSEELGTGGSRSIALHCLGLATFLRGDPLAARPLLEESVVLADQSIPRTRESATQFNPSINARAYLGPVLCALGETEEGLTTAEEAIAISRDLGEPLGLAYSLAFACWVREMRQEPGHVLELSRELLRLAEEYRLDYWLDIGTIQHGWARAVVEKPWRGSVTLPAV
jgi:hypothetical protein